MNDLRSDAVPNGTQSVVRCVVGEAKRRRRPPFDPAAGMIGR
jgi:hypothetical protein